MLQLDRYGRTRLTLASTPKGETGMMVFLALLVALLGGTNGSSHHTAFTNHPSTGHVVVTPFDGISGGPSVNGCTDPNGCDDGVSGGPSHP